MRLISSIFLCLAFCSFLKYDHQERGDFKVEMENGGSFNVFTLKDDEGLLDKYRANIIAPVCEDRVCYDVNLVFNWNLIGEFIDFEILSSEPLTKLDHVPFAPEDYQRLQSILRNQDLNFVKIPAEELVEKSDKPKLDGYSGATKETVKKEVIEGALYTCYTLWHVANGAVTDSIKSHTAHALNEELVAKIAGQKNQTANYFLINHLDEKGFKENIKTILDLITESKGYFSKNAIEEIPQKLFGLDSVQEFIISNYKDFDYYTQKAILLKLENVSNLSATSQFFIEQLSIENSFSNQKIIGLVLKNIDKSIFERLIEHLSSNGIPVSEENYTELEKRNTVYSFNLQGIEKL